MRIGMIHWAFPPTIGGVETHLASLGTELVRQGHNVFILTENLNGMTGKDKYNGIQLERDPLLNLSNFEKSIPVYIDDYKKLYKLVEKRIRKWVNDINPDILHVHNLNCFLPYHPVACKKICREKRIPLVLTVHQVWKENPTFVAFTNNIGWDKIIAVSRFVKSELLKIGTRGRRIEVVYHGLDHNKYRPRTREELEPLYMRYPRLRNKRIILHPARVSIGKGCEVSIRAIEIVKQKFPDALLVLTGVGKQVLFYNKDDLYKGDIIEDIKRFKLKNNVFYSNFSFDDMLMLYSAAEVVIYPTTGSIEKGNEAFGLATIEANSSGKPIIVSTSGALPELIKSGFNGWIVPKHNHEKLAERIIYALSNDSIRNKVGITGRRNVEKKFTNEIMAKNTLKVYKKLL